MSGIAGIIHWDASCTTPSQIDLLLQPIRHRGEHGLNGETIGQVSLGQATFALQDNTTSPTTPVWSPDHSCGIVADVHLYNREELLSRLGEVPWFRGRPSDAALILAVYERWGEAVLKHLDGDFAFAIWDRSRQRIFAARDPFGVKPFFFRWDPQRFLFGSEPKQLLMLPDVPVLPDDMIIGEYLFLKFEDIAHTFFSGIQRLQPGHYLLATRRGFQPRRYWNPDPQQELSYRKREDYLVQFRHLLKMAVAKRLSSDFPIGIQLSGGLDSSSIVVLARELYERDPAGYPRVETLSATFGDLPCDESQYIEAITRQSPFRQHTFCPLDLVLTEGLAEAFWRVDSPFVSIERGLFSYCANILSAVGARTLLTGLGGDELVHEPYFLRDLARQKRYLRLFLESWKLGKNSGDAAVRLCFDAVRSSVPASITQWSRRVRKTVWQPPDWVTPTFRDFFSHCPEPPPLPQMGFRSLTQEATFQWLNSPAFGWFLEGMEVEGAYAGFAVRHPFLDRPLAEFVLAIPFEARLPEGQWKSLLRRSLAGDLPPEIAQRRQKTVFTAYHVHLLTSSRTSLMETLFAANQWAAESYIVRANALRLFQEFSGQNAATPWFVVETLWRIATLELWLRQLSRYQKMKKASIRTMLAWEGEAVAGAIEVASTKEIGSQTETHECEEHNGAVDVAG